MRSKTRNCLTCRWAKSDGDDSDGRTTDINCQFPVPENMPESWKLRSPDISYFRYDEGESKKPYVGVTHIEYFDEREILDCGGYERGKNDLKVFRVERRGEE